MDYAILFLFAAVVMVAIGQLLSRRVRIRAIKYVDGIPVGYFVLTGPLWKVWLKTQWIMWRNHDADPRL